MSTAFAILVAAACLILTALGTRVVLGWLRRRQILDIPNERSSHDRPIPRGGGLAVTPVLVVGLIALGQQGAVPEGVAVISLIALGLFGLSWMDDRHSLSARIRLLAHLIAVSGGLVVLPPDALVFQGWLPFWADRIAAALAWAWFVNLYNFMDGIDGITGVETASLGLGLGVIALWAGYPTYLGGGLVLAAVATGFLVWNWHPARIFLGDSGSVPLGFVLGWLLLHAAASGLWAPALILPLYYLADATITIGRRAIRGERIWQAHRQHFYQRAVTAGATHSFVATSVLVCNLALMAAAALTLAVDAIFGLAVAVLLVGIFLGMLTWRSRLAKPAS